MAFFLSLKNKTKQQHNKQTPPPTNQTTKTSELYIYFMMDGWGWPGRWKGRSSSPQKRGTMLQRQDHLKPISFSLSIPRHGASHGQSLWAGRSDKAASIWVREIIGLRLRTMDPRILLKPFSSHLPLPLLSSHRHKTALLAHSTS